MLLHQNGNLVRHLKGNSSSMGTICIEDLKNRTLLLVILPLVTPFIQLSLMLRLWSKRRGAVVEESWQNGTTRSQFCLLMIQGLESVILDGTCNYL